MLARWRLWSLLMIIYTIRSVAALGELKVNLKTFDNDHGLTFDGGCCDNWPTGGWGCMYKCDYVMRVVVSGLSRANDHVFLFHRPIVYNRNNIDFRENKWAGQLSIPFDKWPGQVEISFYFYDYDDYDDTTLLVDWFETELSQKSVTSDLISADIWGERPNAKTRLIFDWEVTCSRGQDCIETPQPPSLAQESARKAHLETDAPLRDIQASIQHPVMDNDKDVANGKKLSEHTDRDKSSIMDTISSNQYQQRKWKFRHINTNEPPQEKAGGKVHNLSDRDREPFQVYRDQTTMTSQTGTRRKPFNQNLAKWPFVSNKSENSNGSIWYRDLHTFHNKWNGAVENVESWITDRDLRNAQLTTRGSPLSKPPDMTMNNLYDNPYMPSYNNFGRGRVVNAFNKNKVRASKAGMGHPVSDNTWLKQRVIYKNPFVLPTATTKHRAVKYRESDVSGAMQSRAHSTDADVSGAMQSQAHSTDAMDTGAARSPFNPYNYKSDPPGKVSKPFKFRQQNKYGRFSHPISEERFQRKSYNEASVELQRKVKQSDIATDTPRDSDMTRATATPLYSDMTRATDTPLYSDMTRAIDTPLYSDMTRATDTPRDSDMTRATDTPLYSDMTRPVSRIPNRHSQQSRVKTEKSEPSLQKLPKNVHSEIEEENRVLHNTTIHEAMGTHLSSENVSLTYTKTTTASTDYDAKGQADYYEDDDIYYDKDNNKDHTKDNKSYNDKDHNKDHNKDHDKDNKNDEDDTDDDDDNDDDNNDGSDDDDEDDKDDDKDKENKYKDEKDHSDDDDNDKDVDDDDGDHDYDNGAHDADPVDVSNNNWSRNQNMHSKYNLEKDTVLHGTVKSYSGSTRQSVLSQARNTGHNSKFKSGKVDTKSTPSVSGNGVRASQSRIAPTSVPSDYKSHITYVSRQDKLKPPTAEADTVKPVQSSKSTITQSYYRRRTHVTDWMKPKKSTLAQLKHNFKITPLRDSKPTIIPTHKRGSAPSTRQNIHRHVSSGLFKQNGTRPPMYSGTYKIIPTYYTVDSGIKDNPDHKTVTLTNNNNTSTASKQNPTNRKHRPISFTNVNLDIEQSILTRSTQHALKKHTHHVTKYKHRNQMIEPSMDVPITTTPRPDVIPPVKNDTMADISPTRNIDHTEILHPQEAAKVKLQTTKSWKAKWYVSGTREFTLSPLHEKDKDRLKTSKQVDEMEQGVYEDTSVADSAYVLKDNNSQSTIINRKINIKKDTNKPQSGLNRVLSRKLSTPKGEQMTQTDEKDKQSDLEAAQHVIELITHSARFTTTNRESNTDAIRFTSNESQEYSPLLSMSAQSIEIISSSHSPILEGKSKAGYTTSVLPPDQHKQRHLKTDSTDIIHNTIPPRSPLTRAVVDIVGRLVLPVDDSRNVSEGKRPVQGNNERKTATIGILQSGSTLSTYNDKDTEPEIYITTKETQRIKNATIRKHKTVKVPTTLTEKNDDSVKDIRVLESHHTISRRVTDRIATDNFRDRTTDVPNSSMTKRTIATRKTFIRTNQRPVIRSEKSEYKMSHPEPESGSKLLAKNGNDYVKSTKNSVTRIKEDKLVSTNIVTTNLSMYNKANLLEKIKPSKGLEVHMIREDTTLKTIAANAGKMSTGFAFTSKRYNTKTTHLQYVSRKNLPDISRTKQNTNAKHNVSSRITNELLNLIKNNKKLSGQAKVENKAFKKVADKLNVNTKIGITRTFLSTPATNKVLPNTDHANTAKVVVPNVNAPDRSRSTSSRSIKRTTANNVENTSSKKMKDLPVSELKGTPMHYATETTTLADTTLQLSTEKLATASSLTSKSTRSIVNDGTKNADQLQLTFNNSMLMLWPLHDIFGKFPHSTAPPSINNGINDDTKSPSISTLSSTRRARGMMNTMIKMRTSPFTASISRTKYRHGSSTTARSSNVRPITRLPSTAVPQSKTTIKKSTVASASKLTTRKSVLKEESVRNTKSSFSLHIKPNTKTIRIPASKNIQVDHLEIGMKGSLELTDIQISKLREILDNSALLANTKLSDVHNLMDRRIININEDILDISFENGKFYGRTVVPEHISLATTDKNNLVLNNTSHTNDSKPFLYSSSTENGGRRISLSFGKVIQYYWPTILGSLIGAAFLTASILTSIMCSRNRCIYFRRRRLPHDLIYVRGPRRAASNQDSSQEIGDYSCASLCEDV